MTKELKKYPHLAEKIYTMKFEDFKSVVIIGDEILLMHKDTDDQSTVSFETVEIAQEVYELLCILLK